MRKHRRQELCVFAALLAAGNAAAAAPPATSLNNCQNAVKSATATFIKNTVTAIGSCLQAVSTQIVQNNAADASGAGSTCVTQFRKLYDSRGLGKQLSDKLSAAIAKKCAPGQPGVSHTLGDITGSGAGVAQPLDADNLGTWCSHYGGNGSIASLQDWIDCITAAAECDVDSAIASQYPRVLDWLNRAQPAMSLASAGSDISKVTDALAALATLRTELDPNGANVVSVQCGGIGSSGTATAADVLSGRTFSNGSAGGLTGTMPNNGAVTLTPGTMNQAISAGYHNGSGYCAGDMNLAAANIKTGTSIFGVSGSVLQASGNATVGDVLAGKTFSNAAGSGTGTMLDNGAVLLTPGTSDQAIASGYHNGSGKCAGDASLTSDNIRSGSTIFGVGGNSDVVNTGGATATAGDMLSGKTAYGNGSLMTGTVAAGSNVTGSNCSLSMTIPDGLYTGAKTAVANDTNLTAANIANGVTIFGVMGTALSAQVVLTTGQTTCYDAWGTVIDCAGTGQDGELQKGLPSSYVDNGDGTITDTRTGLMWEKLSNDGSIDQYNTYYLWADAFTKISSLNSANFARHADWRLPNVNELQTLAKFGSFPAIDRVFTTDCPVGCTVLSCSCTQPYYYWSSSTDQDYPGGAWGVGFNNGSVTTFYKLGTLHVRGVRGGS